MWPIHIHAPKTQEYKTKQLPTPQSTNPNSWKPLSTQSMQSLTSIFLTKAAKEQDSFRDITIPQTYLRYKQMSKDSN